MKYVKCSVKTFDSKATSEEIKGLSFDEIDPKAIPAILSLSRPGYRIQIALDEVEVEIGADGIPVEKKDA